ncbi:hypothetical protein [Sphingobium sp. YR657]|uniref:hypothetical protein n=1 Tax=Sphingobium sp. YR657 TaxID=1884366 RepID=UPI003137C916
MDGFIGGREIVAGVRAQLSGLSTGQRVAFGCGQLDALTECPDSVMRISSENLLPAWRALEASFRLEYVAGFVGDIIPREMAGRLLIQATNFNAEAATLFDKAGARLVTDVMVPQAVVMEITRRKARKAT